MNLIEWKEKLGTNLFFGTLHKFYKTHYLDQYIYAEDFLIYLKNNNFTKKDIDMYVENIISSNELKKCSGSHYTPSDIQTVIEFPKNMKKIEVLEPACGAGSLVIMLVKEMKINKTDFSITCVDISADAIECTKFRMSLIGKYDATFICADFLTVDFKNEKFDYIIANPPYIERKIEGFKYAKGNLYSYFMEKAIYLCKNEESSLSFIVPYSIVATERMRNIRMYLEKKFSCVKYANFADRPGSLFPKAHQRITIVNANKINDGVFYSEYIHFYKAERTEKLSNIRYTKRSSTKYRFSDNIQESIVKKISNNENYIPIKCNNYAVYINPRLGFWMKAFMEQKSDSYTTLGTNSLREQHFLYCYVNSTLFYFMWLISGDGWHLTRKDLTKIYFPNFDVLDNNVFENLAKKLENDLEKNKKWVNTKQVEYEYKHKLSKLLIDKIDIELGKVFGLTNEEIQYVIKFNEKYRMGEGI